MKSKFAIGFVVAASALFCVPAFAEDDAGVDATTVAATGDNGDGGDDAATTIATTTDNNPADSPDNNSGASFAEAVGEKESDESPFGIDFSLPKKITENFRKTCSELFWEQIFTPARSLLFSGTTSVTPFSLIASVRFPAAISKGGQLMCSTYGLDVSWQHVSEEEKYIALMSLDYRRSDYHFSGTHRNISPNGRTPFAHIDSFSLFTWQEYIFDKDNGRAVAGFLSGLLESEDSCALRYGSSLAIGLGAKQYFSRDTAIWVGVNMSYSRTRERWQFFPFGIFNCALGHDLSLRLGNGAQISWDVGGENKWLLSLAANYGSETFSVGRGKNWQVQSIPLTLTAQWNLTKEIFVSLSVESLLWSKYRLWENGNRSSYHFSSDPTIGLALQAGLHF